MFILYILPIILTPLYLRMFTCCNGIRDIGLVICFMLLWPLWIPLWLTMFAQMAIEGMWTKYLHGIFRLDRKPNGSI